MRLRPRVPVPAIATATLLCLLAMTASAGTVNLHAQPQPGAAPGMPKPGDWPMFLYDNQRQNYNPHEFALSPATAPYVRLKWMAHVTDGAMVASPAIVGDTAYIGAWDGLMYALDLNDGSARWQVPLGTSASELIACKPNSAGISSGAAVDNGVVYVGGGAEHFYALRADTGQPVWRLFTGESSPVDGNYNWASPLVAGGRVYSGIASFCDHPFVRGFMFSAGAADGSDEQRAYIVPQGVVGGGIWTSPTLDEPNNRMFLTTGSPPRAQGHVDSIVAVDLSTYEIVDSWRVPREDEVADADWGTTPTLFTLSDGRQMVAAGNKNGNFYVFDANNLAQGPLWQHSVAGPGECPQCGEGTIASAVYHDGVLYFAGGMTTLDGVPYNGSVQAFEAATGNLLWTYPSGGPVMASPAGANGVIVAMGDNEMHLIDAAKGTNLLKVVLDGAVYGAPVISRGVIYVATATGNLYAFEVPQELVTPVATRPTATAIGGPTTPEPAPTGTTATLSPARTPAATTQPPPAIDPVPKPNNSSTLYFEQTGHTLAPPLRRYWEQYGGLPQFGYPLTETFTETITLDTGIRQDYLVQYFERARFEHHPEHAGTPYEVLLGALGRHFHPQDPPAEALIGPAIFPPVLVYFNETGHNLGGPFLRYWQENGGLFVNGYPTSEELMEVSPTDGKTYKVQYFERARFEHHSEHADTPNEVLLGLLGQQLLQERGWLP
ncbi:MAG TPA: PQQ-binding-like beta-propeller repeat protein [Chloroflexia bacterium]